MTEEVFQKKDFWCPDFIIELPRMVWITSQQQRRWALGIMAEIAGSMEVGVLWPGLRRRESVSLGFVVDGSDDVFVFRRMWYTVYFYITSNRSARSRSC